MVSNKVALSTTIFAKLLPLFIVVPLFFNLQRFDFLPQVNFNIEQFAYLLALGIISVISFIEFRIAQHEQGNIKGLNVGSALAIILVVVGLSFIVFVVATNYDYSDSTINQWISTYMGIAIFVLSVQAVREIFKARTLIKTTGSSYLT